MIVRVAVFVVDTVLVTVETPVGEITGLTERVFVEAILGVPKPGVIVRDPVSATLYVGEVENVTAAIVGDTESLAFIEAYIIDFIDEGDDDSDDTRDLENITEGETVYVEIEGLGVAEEIEDKVEIPVVDAVPEPDAENDDLIDRVAVGESVCDPVCSDVNVIRALCDTEADFIDDIEGADDRLDESVAVGDKVPEEHDEAEGVAVREGSFDGDESAVCDVVTLPDFVAVGELLSEALSVSWKEPLILTVAVAEPVIKPDSFGGCVIAVEKVAETEGLGLSVVVRTGDFEADDENVVDRVGSPVREMRADRVAVPPVRVITAEYDDDDVLLFVTARHTVGLTDEDGDSEREGPKDLLIEGEPDGERLTNAERLTVLEVEGEVEIESEPETVDEMEVE